MSLPSESFHFLNVKEGDCSIIKHGASQHIGVIDVCNARSASWSSLLTDIFKAASDARTKEGGNYGQKANPENPISYLKKFGESSIFRFALTHPDMDHMDGIKDLFTDFNPVNFYDTDNTKEMGPFQGSPYREEDWTFYKSLRDQKPQTDPRRITLFPPGEGVHRTEDWNGNKPGDSFWTLAPTRELLAQANENPESDYHDASYVFLWWTNAGRILVPGDSHDATWEYLISQYEEYLTDIELLIAPHHGRDSGRSYDFLKVLNPKMTFFGNARAEHMAYPAWRNRKLEYLTNNQAGSMVVDCTGENLSLYVTNKVYAQVKNPYSQYSEKHQAWYVKDITGWDYRG